MRTRPVDFVAIGLGATVAAVIAVPAALIGNAAGGDGAPLASIVILLGLAAGGAVAAARQTRGTPLTYGISAALVTFAVIQGVGVVRRLVAGDEIGWAGIISSAILTALAGMVGGLVGGRVRRPPPSREGPS
jgi:hypothetical protein